MPKKASSTLPVQARKSGSRFAGSYASQPGLSGSLGAEDGQTSLHLSYVTSMAIGGLEAYNLRELEEMERLGVQVGVFITKFKQGPYMPPASMPLTTAAPLAALTGQLGALLAAPRRYLGLLWESLRSRSLIDFLIAMYWARIMKAHRTDWIHCHWGDHKLFIGYYCHRLTGIPLSVTMHGYEFYENPNWELLERSLTACSQIITISDHNKKLLTKRYPQLGPRAKVVRLFADLSRRSDRELKVKRILIVGGFFPRKGHQTLLEALSILDRQDLHLWIVGYKGPVDVQRLVEESGIAQRVTMFGHVSDEVLHLLYSDCDIFCLPALIGEDGVGEGLPVALMEAMAYGKPIASTFHTGIPELVPDILVPEGDAQALAEALAKLADDESLRQEQGARNRRIIEEDYSSKNVKKLLETFQCRDLSE